MRVTSLVPKTMFTALPWWNDLTAEEKATVEKESRQLATAMLDLAYSKLAIGEHLQTLRNVLEPKRLFVKYLRNFHFSQRTAYRYIRGFENATKMLPENVLRVVASRGVNMIGETEEKPLGVYTEAVKELPPPKRSDPQAIESWLDKVEDKRKEIARAAPERTTIEGDPETLLKETIRFITVRYTRLPEHHKTREAWVKKLMGMILTECGRAEPQKIAPVSVPADYVKGPGRPRAGQKTLFEQHPVSGGEVA